jgi:hypothetical protein
VSVCALEQTVGSLGRLPPSLRLLSLLWNKNNPRGGAVAGLHAWTRNSGEC